MMLGWILNLGFAAGEVNIVVPEISAQRTIKLQQVNRLVSVDTNSRMIDVKSVERIIKQ